MVLQMVVFHSFSWLSNIPCVYIYVCVCIYMYAYIYKISYIFFISSTVSGHLCCFHVLAIVNSAAVDIRVHVSFQIMVFI